MTCKFWSLPVLVLSIILLHNLPAAAADLSNGVAQPGTLLANTTNSYTFSANKADTIVLRLGTKGFDGILRLYGPTGALLGTSYDGTDAELAYVATNSGTFTAQVASYSAGGTGTYNLYFAQFPEPFTVPPGQQGGPMTNGGIYPGTNNQGNLAMWSFSANAGDRIVLRLATTGYDGILRLYGPTGALLGTSYSGTDAELAYTATNGGTFTALVASYASGGTGTYNLYFAQFPEPFIVPPGQQGGPMTNGGIYSGTNNLGNLAIWSFSANTGNNIVLRLGTKGFNGILRLYGPTGALLGTSYSGTDAELAYTATNSGTFTALVASYSSGGTGTYNLYFAQAPEAFIVPPGQQGGPMTNGGIYSGTNNLANLAMWSFSANTGNNIVLRLGTTGFNGILRLYGPTGALLGTAYSGNDAELAYVATNSGTFTALVASYSSGGTGTYNLYFAQSPEAFIVPPGQQGGPMTNGGIYSGTNNLANLGMWSFSANTGNNIVLRLGTTGFNGILRLYGPTGALLGTAYSANDAELAYVATNSGTFTALVASYSAGGTGTYNLYFAQSPEPFIVPPGQQGGPMNYGGAYPGTNNLGNLAMWSFSANAGNRLVLRLGTTGYDGILRLYGPTGALLGTGYSVTDAQLSYTPTNSGTFTALVASYYAGGVGTYVLYYAQFPGSFVVPPGQQGGPLTGATQYNGTISMGDQNVWQFTACTGDTINLRLAPTNFTGNINLYGPTGALLQTAAGSPAIVNYKTTNCGTFSILVSSYYSGGTGTYGFSVNGLEEDMRLCAPIIGRTNLTLNGIGGPTNATFILYTTSNLLTSFNHWAPILTNQFNQQGIFAYSNSFSINQPQQFYRFSVP